MLSGTRQRLRFVILVVLGILAVALPFAYTLGIGSRAFKPHWVRMEQSLPGDGS